MTIGLLSDAHGNLLVFEKCLSFLDRRCDKLMFLGDAFGYMPEGNEILDIIIKKGIDMVLGNHDAMVAGLLPIDSKKEEIYRLTSQKKNLSDAQLRFICSLPTQFSLTENGTFVGLVHGSPWDHLQGYVYENDVDERFDKLPYDILFMAHTHRPFLLTRPNITLVNVGSCGLPRDIGNNACVTVFDTETRAVQQIKVPFNEDAIIARYKDQIHLDVINCLKRKK
ncbi:metallophosphoesterase [Chitinophaga lutea]|uniref:Metallophosphoesterase n=1 Tax=Chitinophaga lutea TaxID=2488634 RepID=A0A3N4Q6S3_9BACT|nr:metallophosphoesterase family protein [Chitinophaga lutea]RPE13231.1 metallophosphoesterase [Chitinophaga lutea]